MHPRESPILRVLASLLAVLVLESVSVADSTVVLNEVMYHPPGNVDDLEWIELHNQMAVDMDISNWALSDGVAFVFPRGTVVPSGGYVVVAANPETLAAETGIAGVLGPFEGRLDNAGERVELRNNSGRVMDSLRYRDSGRWPTAPDGSGATLAKRHPDAGSATPSSWVSSGRVGGTPGARNFALDGGPATVPAGLVSLWRFEGSGASARDSIGESDGTLGDAIERVPGLVGDGAAHFDNSPDAFVDVGAADGFSVRDGVAIEALATIEWSGELGDTDHIFRKQDGTRRLYLAFAHDEAFDDRDVALDPPVQPVLSFGMRAGGVTTALDMPLDGRDGRPTLAELRDGAAHHIVATYDADSGVKAIWIDGVERIRAELEPGAAPSTGGVATAFLGNMAGRRHPYTGTLDEIAFWKRGLSGDEIAAHYENSRGGRDYFAPTEGGGAPATIGLAFNEVFAGDGDPWVEVISTSAAELELEGLTIASSADGAEPFVFPAQALPPGERVVLGPDDLGFPLTVGDKLFLYSRDGSAVVAAALVEESRARSPDGSGPWFVPAEATPSAENKVVLETDIVINEIHYHPKPILAAPGSFEERVMFPIDSVWRYDASGADLGTAWRSENFDDSTWPLGPALLFVERSDLAAPKNTELELGALTYYFRSEFDLDAEPGDIDVQLRLFVDDGAVVYLNGEEVIRQNMPEGEITAETEATRSVGNARFSEAYPLPIEHLRAGMNLLAVEVHQSSENSNDIVFGAEVSELITLVAPTHYTENELGWLELYNRGDAAVDLTGWEFTNGIAFAFPDGTTLGAGEHLVLASDRDAFSARYPGVEAHGNFTGRLSHRSDRLVLSDANGNPADELRYFDRKPWPGEADGNGSSLELRNAWSDNAIASAWAASDESAAEWETIAYRGTGSQRLGPTQWNEFVFGLFDAGEALIDDMSVVENPGGENERELLQDGGFDRGGDTWRFLGTHGKSRVVDDPDAEGNKVLHLVATGATEHMHNHVETTLADGARVVSGNTYEISFRARWLSGSRQLHTRLYFNRVARTNVLAAPSPNGTPGERNSRYEANAAPNLDRLNHSPLFPEVGESVTVSVHANDDNDLRRVTLFWSVDGGDWQQTGMARGDGSRFAGEIPGIESPSDVIQFYVEAEDEAGAISTLPPGGPASGALYKTADTLAGQANAFPLRILVSPAVDRELHEITNLMSNAKVPATVIYREREVFYDVGVRLRGSQRGRPDNNRTGFHITFSPEQPFRGVHRTISIDRSGGWAGFVPFGAQDEILVKHIATHAGGIPGMYDDLIRVIAPRRIHSGSALLLMARFSSVYLDSQFENGGDGTKYTYELIYHPTTSIGGVEGPKRPLPDSVLGTDHTNLGDGKENYRWFYLIENNVQRDDYSTIQRFAQLLGGNDRAAIDAGSREIMDVDQWMRAFAMYSLCGIGDTYMSGNFHNNIYYVRPEDERVLVFPWDMDFAFVASTGAPLWGGHNLRKVIEIPRNTRALYRHLAEIIDSTFNRDYMTPWVQHYGAVARQSYTGALTYIAARERFVSGRLPREVAFEITSNEGEDFETAEAEVTLEGSAWIDVASVLVADVDPPPDADWASVTRWRVTVPLAPGANELILLAFDAAGSLLTSDRIVVTRTTDDGPLFVRGDVDGNGRIQVTDAIGVLLHLFAGKPANCEDAADVDDDGELRGSDAVRLLSYLFQRGEAPPAPFPALGTDPTPDGIECRITPDR